MRIEPINILIVAPFPGILLKYFGMRSLEELINCQMGEPHLEAKCPALSFEGDRYLDLIT